MNGYVMVRLGRSVTERIRPPNASSVKRSSTSPGWIRMTGAQPPNVQAYWSSVGTKRVIARSEVITSSAVSAHPSVSAAATAPTTSAGKIQRRNGGVVTCGVSGGRRAPATSLAREECRMVFRRLIVAGAALGLLVAVAGPVAAKDPNADGYTVTTLVTGPTPDADLVNAWGLSRLAGS